MADSGIQKQMPGLEAYHPSLACGLLQMSGPKVSCKFKGIKNFTPEFHIIFKVCCENAWQNPQIFAIYMELDT